AARGPQSRLSPFIALQRDDSTAPRPCAWRGLRRRGRAAMMDGSDRMEFADVHVVSANDYILTCRIGTRVVAVRWHSLLPGTEIKATGDRGLLVVTREAAVSFRLPWPRPASNLAGN